MLAVQRLPEQISQGMGLGEFGDQDIWGLGFGSLGHLGHWVSGPCGHQGGIRGSQDKGE